MKKSIALLTVVQFLLLNTAFSQADLRFKIDGLANGDTVLLGYYYGEKQYVKDTAVADTKGAFQFSYPKSLDQGLYLLVFPKASNEYTEFILDADQQFEMTAKLNDLSGTSNYKGSESNSLFINYLRKLNAFKKETQGKDSLGLAEIDAKVKTEQQRIYQQYPNSFLSKLLAWQERPVIPTSYRENNERYLFYKTHFFDRMEWSFTAILRTPVYHAAIIEYVDQLTVQTPDSIIAACDLLLAKTQSNKELFKYTLITLTNKYASSKTVCFDNIYVHLVDNYYLTGRAFWIVEESDKANLERMKSSVERLRPIQCGKPAMNFTLEDENGIQHALYDIKSPYTLLMFWSTDCQHCEEAIRKMNNLEPLLIQKGVKLITIAEGSNRELWLVKKATFPIKSILALMTSDPVVIQSIIDNYDIYATPSFFLLDQEKKIVYKKFDAEDLNKIINNLPNN